MAIGLAHTNPDRAAKELLNLARGQWADGRIPHMIYSRRLPYRLEATFWGTGRLSPRGVPTSGITQPPMLAVAAEQVASALPHHERDSFIHELLPVITRYHEWIYRDRDPGLTGLAAVLHPWECGMDDTPYWTEMMKFLPKPPLHWRWLREYRRVKPDERATPADLQRMLSLCYTLKRCHYDGPTAMERSRVIVHDLVFNSILAAANESLERLAESIGESVSPPLRAHFAPTRRALESLWDHTASQYFSRDYLSGQPITVPTIAAFMPLFAGTASPARADQLRRHIVDNSGFNVPHPLPSVPTTSHHFEPQRYWRGPVWINMNWFVIKGLQRYGFVEEGDWLRRRTLELIQQSGFREYYNPLTGDGLGAKDFSWTAALTLDLLDHKKPQ